MAADLTRFVRLALSCVRREYPNQIAHVLRDDSDALTPSQLTPAFYGCYDWHSAVHGHWLIARYLRLQPAGPLARRAEEALDSSLTSAKLGAEHRYLRARPAFERPYGLAWLLRLHAELLLLEGERAAGWASAVEPLAALCEQRIAAWLPKLSHPVRTGVHSQTSFALGLALEWAETVGNPAFAALVRDRALAWHADDRDLAIHLEPSGEDFLSPSLGVADLVSRLVDRDDLAEWLSRALPGIPADGAAAWLEPVAATDPTDGRLAHLDGLNLSRAWMLERVAGRLPGDDARRPALRAAGDAHATRGLAAVSDEHYEGSHWLGTFAARLLTG